MIKLFHLFRKSFIKTVTFHGDYADIHIARKKWIAQHKEDVILLTLKPTYEKKKSKHSTRIKEKITSLTLYYVDDNKFMNWIGYRKNFVHLMLMR